jgi:calcium/proton exchanger cax
MRLASREQQHQPPARLGVQVAWHEHGTEMHALAMAPIEHEHATQAAMADQQRRVLASFVIGPGPMPFVLNGLEVGAIVFAALIANYVAAEGESNWFEGVQLLAVYALLAVVFGYA